MEWQNKWKPTDRALIPKVLESIPDAELFRRMQEIESNLDALVQRKRLDLQDMIGRSMRKNETLRIFISSSISGQPWQQGTTLGSEPANPHWSLRIEGRLVNDNKEKSRAFSSMITSVIVELNNKKSFEQRTEMEGVEIHSNKALNDNNSFVPPLDAEASHAPAPNVAPDAAPAAASNAAPDAAPVSAPTTGPLPAPGPLMDNGSVENTNTSAAASVDSGPSPLSVPVNETSSASTAAPGPSGSMPTGENGTESTLQTANAAPSENGASNGVPKVDEVVEWHEACVPPEQRVDFDGLDVRRPGSEQVDARILIQLKEYPDKFKLSPQLAEILGVTEESKPGAVVSLWQYIRYHNLQDVDEKRLIKCDEALFKLFKREKIMLPQLVELLAPHLSPRGPLVIDYTIDPTQDLENRDIAFDVPIQVDHPLRDELLTMLSSWHQDNGAISELEDLLLQDVQALNLLAHQHDFYESFSKDPSSFLDKLVASQARDLKIIYCDRQFSEEAVRHSSFYTDDLLNPSLHLFLGKQQ